MWEIVYAVFAQESTRVAFHVIGGVPLIRRPFKDGTVQTGPDLVRHIAKMPQPTLFWVPKFIKLNHHVSPSSNINYASDSP